MLIRLITRIGVAVTVVLTSVIAMPSPAVAQDVVCSDDGYGGQICYLVVVVETEDGWSVEVEHQSGGEASPWCIRPSTGNYVACQGFGGWFHAETECNINRTDQEPTEDMEGYEEHGAEGVVYIAHCFHEGSTLTGEEVNGVPVEMVPITIADELVLAPGDPEGYGGTPSPLPGLIEEAINSLQLDGADIRMAPNPDGAGLVGLPVWMATPATEQTWGPQSRSAPETGTVQGIAVTAEAQAQNIVWDMGNGDEVPCDNPGTVYEPSYGVTESPTCGYPGYLQRGQYPVTATTNWVITWAATNGANGELEVTTGSTTAVTINELQVLTSLS